MTDGSSSGQHGTNFGHDASSRKSNVVVIGLTYPFRGGISHYSSLLVRALRERHGVEFITLSRQYPGFLFPGVSQFDYSDTTLAEDNEPLIDSMNPLSWVQTARRLNREKPDLILIQWWHPFFSFAFGTIVRLLNKDLRRKVCFLCHNVLPHESNPLQTLLTKYAFRSARLFIVHSSQDRRDLLQLKPDALVKQGCHPTYSEFASMTSSTHSDARNKLGLPQEENVLLFFGLIRQYKGLGVLIDAMTLLSGRLSCQLVIAGEFYDDKTKYLAQIDAAGLSESVRVVDEYIANEDVADYFLASNVVVLPYLSATQSGIVQIAFGMATPVITTDVGGLPEAVDHGKTGFIVPSNDSKALADAIVRFFDDDVESSFRSNIRGQTERFSWDHEMGLIEEFLDEIT